MERVPRFVRRLGATKVTDPTRLREIVERLIEADVRFVLVGGLAVIAWGYLRTTHDVDLVPDPDPDNLERLARLMEDLGGKVEVKDETLGPGAIRLFLRSGDKALIRTELGVVDVLQGIPQIPQFSELASRAVQADLDGVSVTVCSLADLRAMKRAADRHLDRADLEALEAAHPEGET